MKNEICKLYAVATHLPFSVSDAFTSIRPCFCKYPKIPLLKTGEILGFPADTIDDREFKDLNKQSENVKPQNKKSDQFAGLGRDLYSHMRGSRDEAILPCKCGIMYKVNIKTRSMSEIKVKDNVIAIESGLNAPIATIPPTIVNKLGAEVGEDVFFKVSTAKSLAKFLSKKPPHIKFLICGKEKL